MGDRANGGGRGKEKARERAPTSVGGAGPAGTSVSPRAPVRGTNPASGKSGLPTQPPGGPGAHSLHPCRGGLPTVSLQPQFPGGGSEVKGHKVTKLERGRARPFEAATPPQPRPCATSHEPLPIMLPGQGAGAAGSAGPRAGRGWGPQTPGGWASATDQWTPWSPGPWEIESRRAGQLQ